MKIFLLNIHVSKKQKKIKANITMKRKRNWINIFIYMNILFKE